MAKVVAGYDPNVDPSQGGEYKTKPPGVYQLEIKEVEQREGNVAPQLMIKCQIAGSSHGDNVGDRVTLWQSFSPKATPYGLVPLLEATGIDFEETTVQSPDGAQVPALSFDTDDLIGRTFQATNKPRKDDYRGGMKDNFSFFEPSQLGGGAATPAPRQAQTPPRQASTPPRAAGRRRVG